MSISNFQCLFDNGSGRPLYIIVLAVFHLGTLCTIYKSVATPQQVNPQFITPICFSELIDTAELIGEKKQQVDEFSMTIEGRVCLAASD
jgi:hypothetical protein